MNVHDPYVSLETAKLLKEAGFNEATQFGYRLSDGQIVFEGMSLLCHNNLEEYASAPRLDVAQRWLREVEKIDVLIEKRFCAYVYSLGNISDEYENVIIPEMSTGFDTYEQALEAGIKKAVKHLLKIRSEVSEIKKMFLQNNYC